MFCRATQLLGAAAVAVISLLPIGAQAGEGPHIGVRPNACAVRPDLCDEIESLYAPWVRFCESHGQVRQRNVNYWDPTATSGFPVVAYNIDMAWGGSCPVGDFVVCSASLATPFTPTSPVRTATSDQGACPESIRLNEQIGVPYASPIKLTVNTEGGDLPARMECIYVAGVEVGGLPFEDCTTLYG